MLRQLMQDPYQGHWDAAIRLLRYLKSNLCQGILLSSSTHFNFKIYCDSNWARCAMTYRSIMRYFIQLGTPRISRKIKKQDMVSHSSTEARHRTMANAGSETMWLHNLLKFHSIPVSSTVLHCYN